MRGIKFDSVAYRDYREWLRTNPKIAERIDELIRDILHDPFKGIGKPEALKHNWQGYWSRRITDEHRLIYKVTEESIIIASCRFHYS
ncbi:MAG TPA: Txe/YoeB family addiction module toxin [Bacteroidia bacterium]|nr:Txe/YoeB family addiction module toxin [Bacteroidia bacterium]